MACHSFLLDCGPLKGKEIIELVFVPLVPEVL